MIHYRMESSTTATNNNSRNNNNDDVHDGRSSSSSSSSTKVEDDEIESDPDRMWNDPTFQRAQAFLDVPTTDVASKTRDNASSSCSTTRLVLISDTHGNHNDIPHLPLTGDVLIHAGDFTKTGEPGSIGSLAQYFESATMSQQQHGYKQVICIAGNHDIIFDHDFYPEHWNRFQRVYNPAIQQQEELKSSCTFLNDSSCQLYCGCDNTSNRSSNSKVYGSPWSSRFYDWAFNINRGRDSDKLYSQIPDDTDILITHGPPLGRGDLTNRNQRAGCVDLLRHVQQRIKPRVHVFGHIHENAGVISYDGTTLFVNACVVDLHYKVKQNPCIVIDLPHDKSKPAQVVQPNCTLTSKQFQGWLENNNYNLLSEYYKEAIKDNNDDAAAPAATLLDRLPNENEWLQHETAFVNVCDALLLHRDVQAQHELRRVLAQIHVESFS